MNIKKNKVQNICVGYPPFEYNQGIPLLSQNRQFQWFNKPTFIYPVIPATAATMIKNAGYNIHFLDAIVKGMSTIQWFDYIEEIKPDLIFFEVKTPVIYYIWDIVDSLKDRYPDMYVVLGGDHVTAMPEESMEHSKVDFILTGGDFDFLLLNLINYLNGKEPIEKGIYYRGLKNTVKNSGQFELIHTLDELPFIDRDLTEWKRYAYQNGNYKRLPGTYIMAGRDCWHHRCTFCSWTTLFNNFRLRTPINVVDEIEMLVSRYQVKEIMDDTGCFPVGEWLNVFCQTMIERKLNNHVTLDCNMRFGVLSFNDYKLMKKAGFRFLLFGLESANQKTLDKIEKNMKVEVIENSLRNAKQAGLSPHITVMIGYPWENEGDIARTLELTKKLLLKGYANTMQATIIIPYPGTKMFNEAKANNELLTENWAMYDMRQAILKTEVGEKRIKEYIQAFYNLSFNPMFLMHKVLSIRDLDDILYYVRAFKKVFFGHLRDFD